MTRGPFFHTPQTSRALMFQVVVALTPAMGFAIWRYGMHAAVLITGSIAGALVVDAVCARRMPTDGSALVTGVIFSMLLPANAPWWIGVAGGAIAIGVGKYAFGGLGKNPFNPAALSRALLMGLTPAYFFATKWPAPNGVDAVSGATPLSKEASAFAPEILDVLLGRVPGALGQAAPIAIIAGGMLLILLRTIDWRVPLCYVAAVCFFALVLPTGDRVAGHAPWLIGNPLMHVLAGGTLFAAFFMLTDPVTAPFTNGGRVLFAVIAGAFTIIPRFYTPFPDSVVLAVLVANACAPFIDRVVLPKPAKHQPRIELPKQAGIISMDPVDDGS